MELDLSRNNLSRVMSGVFAGLARLQTLALSDNRLRLVLQSGFKDLPALQFLSLARNDLRSLPVFLLREMPSLKVLDFSSNRVVNLPYLTRSPELVILNANFNHLDAVSGFRFSGLTNLEYVYLRGNRLTTVRSPLFRQAPSLTILDLRENQITKVHPFGYHPSLMFVLLENNQIQVSV